VTAEGPADGDADGRRTSTLSALTLGVACGAILVPLNTTMLAVALPGMMGEFGLTASEVASVVTLYLGAVAVALPVSGSLGDRFGHRTTFLAGVVAFGVASLLAALSTTFAVLEGARVLQAVSGALVSTSSIAIIREISPPGRRGEAFGLFDLLTSVSATVGPFIGGLLVGAFGWRSMFSLAVPIAVLAAASVWLLLDPHRLRDARATARPVDIRGLVVLGGAIAAFLVALRAGATLPGLGAFAAMIVLLVVFVMLELRTDHPAIDPRLFRSRGFSAAVAGVFGATVVLHGLFLMVPLLVERLLGASATATGIVLLGIAGVSAVVAPYGGRVSDRLGRRRPAVQGSLIMALGVGLLALATGTGPALAVGGLLVLATVLLGVVGLGMGLAGSPRQASAMEAVGGDRVGMAAGTYFTGRYLGGLVGASLGGAVLGGAVTAAGMTLGFTILAGVAVAVAVVSIGLPGRVGSGVRSAEPAGRRASS
jgi:EmrB/QacA subfamily drug resistance transporter